MSEEARIYIRNNESDSYNEPSHFDNLIDFIKKHWLILLLIILVVWYFYHQKHSENGRSGTVLNLGASYSTNRIPIGTTTPSGFRHLL